MRKSRRTIPLDRLISDERPLAFTSLCQLVRVMLSLDCILSSNSSRVDGERLPVLAHGCIS